jgi:hypothetical protein
LTTCANGVVAEAVEAEPTGVPEGPTGEVEEPRAVVEESGGCGLPDDTNRLTAADTMFSVAVS